MKFCSRRRPLPVSVRIHDFVKYRSGTCFTDSALRDKQARTAPFRCLGGTFARTRVTPRQNVGVALKYGITKETINGFMIEKKNLYGYCIMFSSVHLRIMKVYFY